MFSRTENPNAIVGLFLLVLLAVFVGPNMLPRLVSSFIPGADEGVPCSRLRTASDRANHQSLIGRAAVDPIGLTVRTSAIPVDPQGTFEVRITVINNSLGTVPIIYNENQVIVGDNNTSGLGLIFTPQVGLTTGATRQDSGTFPEANIRLLGPRQRCIHRAVFPFNQAGALFGNVEVRAFYRINSAGTITQAQIGVPTPIFNDQGLNIIRGGYVESPPVTIPPPQVTSQ
jgi:hypothetical protein